MEDSKMDIERKILTPQEFTDKFMGIKDAMLKFVIFKMYLTVEDAEDLVQEAYIKGLKGIHGFDTNTNFVTWFYTIAKRINIDNYRKIKDIQKVDVEVDALELMLNYDSNGGDEIFIKNDIDKALDKIKSPLDREIFIMYCDGYQYNDIAEKLKQPLGTVKGKIHRAKAVLTKDLVMYKNE